MRKQPYLSYCELAVLRRFVAAHGHPLEPRILVIRGRVPSALFQRSAVAHALKKYLTFIGA